MAKKVVWQKPKVTGKPAGTYGSFQELMAKANRIRKEQEEAQAYLQKAAPGMLKLLEIRFTNGEPLKVMRPFQYMSSELEKSDGFYANQSGMDKFVDVQKTIYPGTMLLLKSIDEPLQEFIFVDGQGQEHAINFCYRNQLMTQTDIFETVKQLIEMKETKS